MRKIYADYFISLKEKSGKSFAALEKDIGRSASTICRWLKEEGEPTFEEILLLCEAMGGNPRDLFASVGEQELKASEKVDYMGADALLEDFARREAIYRENCDQRVAHQIELRQELQKSFDTMVATLAREHEAALTKRDETYDRTTSYLKKLVDTLEDKNAKLMERMKDAERRAEVAEQMRSDIDKRRHHVFWGMLILCFAMLVVGIAIYPPWA